MKAILEFNLPEDKVEADMAMHVGDLHSAILAYNQKLRQIIKYSDNEEEAAKAEWARELLWEELEDCRGFFEF